jgi:hypothetical protein
MAKKKPAPTASTIEAPKLATRAGVPNIREVGTVAPSRCPKCRSTERTAYANTTEKPIVGLHEGEPYTHVVWRSTTCAACGQARRDRSFENRGEPAEKK